jgi:hypothetical protein
VPLIPVDAFSETYVGNQILLALIAICHSAIANPQILGPLLANHYSAIFFLSAFRYFHWIMDYIMKKVLVNICGSLTRKSLKIGILISNILVRKFTDTICITYLLVTRVFLLAGKSYCSDYLFSSSMKPNITLHKVM